jgi:phosphoribosylaminoimidazolecarboxamide formyltransferase / IMP cyclohydrolase
VLRYGENPHQAGARYREAGRRLVGRRGAARRPGALLPQPVRRRRRLAARHAFPGRPTAVVVKHANPCGVAAVDDADGGLAEAYERAFDADPKSAFGGVVALNGVVDLALAESLVANPKADVLIAAGYDEDARELLVRKRKAMRVLEAAAPGPAAFGLRRVDGGFLVQTPTSVEATATVGGS